MLIFSPLPPSFSVKVQPFNIISCGGIELPTPIVPEASKQKLLTARRNGLPPYCSASVCIITAFIYMGARPFPTLEGPSEKQKA